MVVFSIFCGAWAQALEFPADIPPVSSLILKTSIHPQTSLGLIKPKWDHIFFAQKISSQIFQIQEDRLEWRSYYKPFENLKLFQAVTYWHDVGFRPSGAPVMMDIAYGSNFSCGGKVYAFKTEKNFAGFLLRGKLLNVTKVGSYNTKANMAFRAGFFFEHQLESVKLLTSLTHEHLKADASDLIQRNTFINFGFTWGER